MNKYISNMELIVIYTALLVLTAMEMLKKYVPFSPNIIWFGFFIEMLINTVSSTMIFWGVVIVLPKIGVRITVGRASVLAVAILIVNWWLALGLR
jgi:hypothetical protein